jgi:hypothetical protein
VHDGFEVTLWAENPMLFKPIQINWDPQGRLWAASSRVYPQIRPGQEAEDAVVVLEDKDGDGVAENVDGVRRRVGDSHGGRAGRQGRVLRRGEPSACCISRTPTAMAGRISGPL